MAAPQHDRRLRGWQDHGSTINRLRLHKGGEQVVSSFRLAPRPPCFATRCAVCSERPKRPQPAVWSPAWFRAKGRRPFLDGAAVASSHHSIGSAYVAAQR